VIAVMLAFKEEAMRGEAGSNYRDEAEMGGAVVKGAGQVVADSVTERRPWIVVCPASLVYNWQDELRRFAPSLSVCLVVGTQKEREEKLRHYGEYDVLVTSYDLLKRDIDHYEDCTFKGEILDEAQFIKNHTTAAAKAVRLIKSEIHYALTGTPIENRLSELWSIFDVLMPGFLYGYEVFRREIETPIVKQQDKDASKRLRRMVTPFILRRLKKDVLKDLPDKLEKVYYAKFETKQQKLYDGQVAHMKQVLAMQDEESYKKDKLKVLAELTRIRQICCDPSLIYENYDGESAKRIACMSLIKQAMEGGHRILLFSQFTSMLALLEEDLNAEKIPYYKITGETPKKKRLELVNDFNEGDTPIFLISLKAGGTGLNLTGADMVIHYDPWWNLAVQNQATDRAHRIGQTNIVSVYRLIVRDSIEEKILQMQETKKDLAEEILSGESGGLSSLSKEELLELLQV
ncbi:MAG: DEAD/DEAH box helicase, partial [Clostridiales bacterium]|nr:DEAD/DEAH box helicase [Clostridiales bacterium]